jgi:hypothetical protein
MLPSCSFEMKLLEVIYLLPQATHLLHYITQELCVGMIVGSLARDDGGEKTT